MGKDPIQRFLPAAGGFLKRICGLLRETDWDSRANWIALALPVLVSAGFALILGQDTSWDVRNYHYYSGFAFLHKPLNYDFAPAQIQSFFNPLLHVLSYLLLAYLPSMAAAALLGAVQGVNFYLLFRIARTLLWDWSPASRFWLSFCSAAAGCCGAAFIAELGTTFGDSIISIPVLAGLLMLLRRFQPDANAGRPSSHTFGIAGAVFGVAFGLKLTTSIYVAAIILALLLFGPASSRRIRAGLLFIVWMALGFAAAYGLWGWNLYSEYGNPVFPYWNAVFRSPYYDLQNVTDARFLPRTWRQTLFYPFFFIHRNRLVGEIEFRDARLALCYLAIAALGIAGLLRRSKRPRRPGGETSLGTQSSGLPFLALFFAASYAVWQLQFSIYRYLVVLEMLAPILMASVLARLFARKSTVIALSLTLYAGICLWMIPPDFGRQDFDDGFLKVEVPGIAELERSVVLMGEEEPTSYIIASFPAGTRFVRLRANFFHPGQNSNLDHRIQAILKQYDSDHTFLYVSDEREMALVAKDAGFYGISLDASSFLPLKSRSASRGFLCRTLKTAPRAIAPFALEPVFTEFAGVELEVSPLTVADRDTVRFTLVGSDIRMIDVLYTLNGSLQPPQERWRLDDRHSVQFPVTAATPKGFYHFIGIRDSASEDPNRWIRVNAELYVR